MTTVSDNSSGASTEPAVDRRGNPVVDPTKNVLDLVAASIQRQDDLRHAESRHVREIVELRAEYDEKLRDAESARIDAIRAVDVGAVNRAAEVSAAQAQTLATQVATSAEALRGQVEAARQQTATALAAALEPIQKDIQDLRRVQYEGVGQKINVADTQAVTSGHTQSSSLIIAVIIGASTVVLAIIGLVLTITLRTK